VEGLHAVIVEYLRQQRRSTSSEAGILGIWRERCATPRCKICGAAIEDDDDGLYNLADMRQVRECHLHYAPF